MLWLRRIYKKFRFFKKLFIGLLSFSVSLATQCMSLNMYITLDKFSENCNAFNNIPEKICVSKQIEQTEHVNLNAFNLKPKTNQLNYVTLFRM